MDYQAELEACRKELHQTIAKVHDLETSQKIVEEENHSKQLQWKDEIKQIKQQLQQKVENNQILQNEFTIY